MTHQFADLEGEAVLLRFESKFNRDRTQTVLGVVREADHHEVVIEADGGDRFRMAWHGDVEQLDDDHSYNHYGVDGRLWTLEEVDQTGDAPEDELNDSDKRTEDPLIN